MSLRLRTTARKQPKQERARETVDVILEAMARTLVRVGYDRASTNRVALEAGVSIGSLYQYFPNKEALVAALIDRHTEMMTARCQGALAEAQGKPLREAVDVVIRSMVLAHAVNPRLHVLLQEQVPRIGKLKRIDQIHDELTNKVRQMLEERQTEVKVDDLELAAFFTVQTVDSLLHAVLSKRDGKWDSERLIQEISRVVVAYLTSPSSL
jgi:AcrR family transcriptional regulator